MGRIVKSDKPPPQPLPRPICSTRTYVYILPPTLQQAEAPEPPQGGNTMALTLMEAAKLSNDMLLTGVIETIVKKSPVL